MSISDLRYLCRVRKQASHINYGLAFALVSIREQGAGHDL